MPEWESSAEVPEWGSVGVSECRGAGVRKCWSVGVLVVREPARRCRQARFGSGGVLKYRGAAGEVPDSDGL